MESLVESWMNVLSGFLISWLMWTYFVAPLYGFDRGHVQALEITCIFTVTSLLRSYAIRRWFNHGWKRAVKSTAAFLARSKAPGKEDQGTHTDTRAKGSN